MKYIILTCFLLLTYSGNSQIFPSQQWRPGLAVLTNGDTLEGLINYNLEADIIQLELEKKIATFNAAQLVCFAVKPDSYRPYRIFYSVPSTNKVGFLVPSFYELMSEGEVSLLGREYIVVIANATNPSFIRPMDSSFARLTSRTANVRKHMGYKLFLANAKGEVIPLGETIKSTLNAFGSNKSKLRKYIKEQRLTLMNVYDFVKLVKYYNELLSS